MASACQSMCLYHIKQTRWVANSFRVRFGCRRWPNKISRQSTLIATVSGLQQQEAVGLQARAERKSRCRGFCQVVAGSLPQNIMEYQQARVSSGQNLHYLPTDSGFAPSRVFGTASLMESSGPIVAPLRKHVCNSQCNICIDIIISL